MRSLSQSGSSLSIEEMLAPPPPAGANGFLQASNNAREQRSNSSVSDSVALFASAAAAASGDREERRRRLSALSVGCRGGTGGATTPSSTQKAFLIRQKRTGEEMVVTMSSVRSPVMGARTVVSHVPRYLANARFVAAQSRPLVNGNKRRSLDDNAVNYNSLMTPSDYNRRFSEMVNAQDALAAKRLEKIYQRARRAATLGPAAATTASDDGVGGPGAEEARLGEWLAEHERRRSCAVGEFAAQAAAHAKTPYLIPPVPPTRSHRAQSFGLAQEPFLLARSCSKRSTKSARCYREGGAGSRRNSALPARAESFEERQRKLRSGSSGNSSTRRHKPGCRNGGGSDTRADLEAAAALLLNEVSGGACGNSSGVNSLPINDEGLRPPPEKERRRIVLIVSCVALAITIFAASLVGLTLGLSNWLEDLTPGRDVNRVRSFVAPRKHFSQDRIFLKLSRLSGSSAIDLE